VAHLRQHKRSPFWSLRRRNLDTGRWEERSTGLRVDDPSETLKAQRAADKASAQEQRIGTPKNSPAFLAWVPDYLASHWRNPGSDSPRRYAGAWQAIRAFLETHGIDYPRQIKYGHGEAYLRWRKATPVNGRMVVHNTALLELKFLSQLITEAIRREFTDSNPIAHLGIARDAAKIKPELTDKQIKTAMHALEPQPQWMADTFEIGLYTGCRFNECEIPVDQINLAKRTIRMEDSKRDENDPRKYFTIPIHPELFPTLKRMVADAKAEKRPAIVSLSADKNGRINKVLKKAVGSTFHSLRVTFITRCHRGGLTESEAMRLVNHSSQIVHRIYSRLDVEDARAAQTKIPLPSFGKGKRARS
jgi:integrase